MSVVLGVDSSTQSTKVEARDLATGEILASASARHPATSPPRSEQDPASWWTAIWNEGPWSDGRSIHTYVDVITPAEWEGDTARMIDLDLDVVRRHSGTVEVDDQDEFDEHRITMAYPDHIVDKARTETARLAIAVESGLEPFGSVGDQWLEVALGH